MPLRVAAIDRTETDEGIEWSARVTYADREHDLRFGGPAALVGQADASMFLAATLLPAMAWQQDLHIEGSVSPLLLQRVDRIVRTYRLLDPTLRAPTVTVAEATRPPSTGTATACFFSRGVDSTYSASVPRSDPAPLDAVVYCRTLEPVHDPANSNQELRLAYEVAERLGLPLHPIWTNLRSFTDPMLGWSAMHGAGLGAMALLVGQAFDRVVIPTAYDVASLVPCGSHPGLDPLFSSESITIHHDHLDRSRQDKLEFLVQERPDLLERLKVCYSDSRVDNCGRCPKCLLTMAGLRVAGGLALATQFPSTLDLSAIRSLRVTNVGLRHLWLAIAHRAEDRRDRELADAIGDFLRLCARPSLREVISGRSRLLDRVVGPPQDPRYDPEWSTSFERFDNYFANEELALVRHGEVVSRASEPQSHRLRASTLAGSIAASLAHRRRPSDPR